VQELWETNCIIRICFVTDSVGSCVMEKLILDNLHSIHKRTLLFQNNVKNKCGILRTSHLRQSMEELKKFYFKWTGSWLYALLPLDATFKTATTQQNPSKVSIYALCKTLEKKWITFKAKSPGPSSCSSTNVHCDRAVTYDLLLSLAPSSPYAE
jgi:hypothetical protein